MSSSEAYMRGEAKAQELIDAIEKAALWCIGRGAAKDDFVNTVTRTASAAFDKIDAGKRDDGGNIHHD